MVVKYMFEIALFLDHKVNNVLWKRLILTELIITLWGRGTKNSVIIYQDVQKRKQMDNR